MNDKLLLKSLSLIYLFIARCPAQKINIKAQKEKRGLFSEAPLAEIPKNN